MILLVLLLLSHATPAGASQHTTDGGTLQAANVRIILERSYAMVVATYRIDRSGEPLVFNAIRLPGQTVDIEIAMGPNFDLAATQRVELHQLTSPAGRSGGANLRVRYTVEGDVSRIPIFIPNTEIPEGTTSIRFTIVGATGESVLEDASPPFAREPDGSLVAAPDEIPSAVLLPAARQSPSRRNTLIWAVVLLVAGAGVYWAGGAIRARRLRRRRAA